MQQQSDEGSCQDCYRSGNPIEDTRLTTIIERLGHSTITVTVDTCGHLFPSIEASLGDALDLAISRVPWAALPHRLRVAHRLSVLRSAAR